jgi:hypothetical protein
MIVVITGFKFSHQNRLMKTRFYIKKAVPSKPLLRFCKEIEIIFEFEKSFNIIKHFCFFLGGKSFCSGYAKETL